MKRRVLSLFLALTMLCTLLPQVSLLAHAETLSGTCGAEGDGSNLTWTLDTETGVLTIEGSGAMAEYDSRINVPWFDYRKAILDVSMTDGVTHICNYAFDECTGLKNVTIPDSVTTIGFCAFFSCTSLLNVTIPDGVTSIGMNAFDGCTSLTSVTIPNSITSISYETFYGCKSLTSVTLGNRVTSIAPFAFYDCDNLTSITIPASIASIGDLALGWKRISGSGASQRVEDFTIYGYNGTAAQSYAEENEFSFVSLGYLDPIFGTCGAEGDGSNLTWTLDFETGTLTIDGSGAMANYYFDSAAPWFAYRGAFSAVSLPFGMTNIGSYAFRGCNALKSVTIPKSVIRIGCCLFSNCTAMTNVTIPAGVMEIGDYAFGWNWNAEAEEWQKTEGFIVYGYNGTTAQTYAEENEFGFISLGSPDPICGTCGAEGDGSNLTWTLDLETKLLTIEGHGKMADYDWNTKPWYEYQNAISTVSLPDGLTNISYSAFSGCSGLTSVTIPDSVTHIDAFAFSDCSALTSIVIPDGVRSIDAYAFDYCTALESVTIGGSVKSIGHEAFENCNALTSVTIPANVTDIGSLAFGWVYSWMDNEYNRVPDFTVYGYEATEAKYYAEENEFSFVSLGSPEPISGTCGAEDDGSNLTWTLNTETGLLTIEGSGEMKYFDTGDNRAPWYAYRRAITSVSLPDGLTNIGYSAFYCCHALANVTIPDSVTEISGWAFGYCFALKEITIPDSVTYIGGLAFNGSGLTSVTIGNSVTSISYMAFSGCSSLTSVTIPDSVTSIESHAFEYCSSLTSASIPDSVKSIGEEAFTNCTALTSVTIPANVTYIGSRAFGWNWNGSDYERVPDYSIYGYNGTAAQTYAEENGFAFVSLGDPTFTGFCGAEGDGSNLTWRLETGSGVLTIEGSGKMANYATYNHAPWDDYCATITAVNLPDGLTSIGSDAFSGCTSLTSVTIPDSVTSIRYDAFSGCTALTSAEIGKGVCEIGYDAFVDCPSLQSVTIPADVYSIGSRAFGYQTVDETSEYVALNDFTIYGIKGTAAQTYAKENGFNFVFLACEPITGNCGAEGDNLTWTLDIETGALTIEGSGDMADASEDNRLWLNYSAGITSVSLPAGMTSIGGGAFRGCNALTNVTIPDSVTSIGEGAFYGCSGLTDVTIPKGLTSISNFMFCDCSGLTSVTIPDGVTSIGNYAFSRCTGLTSITIPDSVTSIGAEAFSRCTGLTNATIGSGVTIIGMEAFIGCTSLTSVTICNGVTGIGWGAFEECIGLTNVTIPDSITSIGGRAFCLCSALTNVTIPDSVTSIGMEAFSRCTSLRRVSIGNGVTSIGNWAFYGCTALKDVTIPSGVASIGERTFGYVQNGEAEDSERVPGFTIYGYNGTAAQTYAEENGFAFVSLDNTVGNFTDVKPKDWYADAVLWAVDNGITAGVDEHHFGPKQNCTREQVVTFLWAAKGCPEPESDANPFKDVKKNSWFRKSVLWAVEQGVTGGVDETHFGVGKACDRAQVVMFLWAAAGKPEPETAENKFTDVKKKDYFYSAVLWAVENGVTGGTTPTTFSPKNICTRAQVVTFLYAAYADK